MGKKYHESGLAKTCAAFDSSNHGKVIGYVTLVCGEIFIEDGDGELIHSADVEYHYQHDPAIKIARLAVDARYRRCGLGSILVNIALGTAKSIVCPAVGCRFVVVDSKKSAVPFHERIGFTILDTQANRDRDEPVLFVDLHKTPA